MVITIAALYFARSVFAPLAFAVFIIALIWPVQRRLQSRMPKLVALAVSVLVTILIFTAFGSMITWSFTRVGRYVVGDSARFQSHYAQLANWLEGHGIVLAGVWAEHFNVGWLLRVNLTTADISDSAGAQPILDAIRKRWPWMKRLFADGAYDRRTLLDKAAFLDFVVEVVRRTDTDPGFKVIPRRWVVERSIGWLTQYRRLVRDYEQRLDVSEAMIFLAMGNLLLRRITHP